MNAFPLLTIDSAPEKSKPALQTAKERMGMIPNLAAAMANSPVLIQGFLGAWLNFNGGNFNGKERQTLLLSNAVRNSCRWAVAFHSTMALREGVSPEDVQAIREKRPPRDPHLAKLSRLTQSLIEKRGHLDAQEIDGFPPEQVLEVIAGLAISTMANYAGNLARPPVEAPFEAQVWNG
jgi:alkylhydroperoxidase family enzyme